MLAKRARELIQRVRTLESRRQLADKADKFKTRAGQLAGPARQLTAVADMVVVMRRRPIPVTLEGEKIASVLQHAESIREAYRADPETILGADGDLRFTFWTPLQGLPQAVEQSLRQSWLAFVEQAIPAGKPDLISVLGRVPSFQKQVTTIRQGSEEAARLRQALPQSEDAITRVEDLASRLRQAWNQLESEEISPEVLAFLRAASTGQATLEHVTPGVKDWLDRHHLLRTFKVML